MCSSDQTTTQDSYQKRDPWGPAKPALQNILNRGAQLFNQNPQDMVYQGDRTAGIGSVTDFALGQMQANAGAGMGGVRAADDFNRGLINWGGSTPATRHAVQQLLNTGEVSTAGLERMAARLGNPNSVAANAAERLTDGDFFQSEAGFNRLNKGLEGPSQVQKSLQSYADGDLLGAANPYMNEMIANAQADAANRVSSTFAASGRYGSGMYGSALGDTVGRIGTEYRYKDYENERARQAQAAQLIDQGLLNRTDAQKGLYTAANDTRTANANQTLAGGQLGLQTDEAAMRGAQALANQRQLNNNQRILERTTALQAAQGDRAAAQAGINQIGTIQSAYQQPARTQLAVGQIRDLARQQDLDAERARFEESANAPWKQLGLYSGAAMPIASAGGTQTGQTVQTTEGPSTLQTILGGVSSALGVAGQTGLLGPAGPAMSALSSGVSGAMRPTSSSTMPMPSYMSTPSYGTTVPQPTYQQPSYGSYGQPAPMYGQSATINPMTGQPYTYGPQNGWL